MMAKVANGFFHRFDIVMEVSNAKIALVAEQPTYLSGGVDMIHTQSGAQLVANSAAPTLFCDHSLELITGYSVKLLSFLRLNVCDVFQISALRARQMLFAVTAVFCKRHNTHLFWMSFFPRADRFYRLVRIGFAPFSRCLKIFFRGLLVILKSLFPEPIFIGLLPFALFFWAAPCHLTDSNRTL